MAAVTICSDFGAQEILELFPLFPHLFAMSDGPVTAAWKLKDVYSLEEKLRLT